MRRLICAFVVRIFHKQVFSSKTVIYLDHVAAMLQMGGGVSVETLSVETIQQPWSRGDGGIVLRGWAVSWTPTESKLSRFLGEFLVMFGGLIKLTTHSQPIWTPDNKILNPLLKQRVIHIPTSSPLTSIYEPSHEIMVLFVLRKLILQTRMRSHPVGLDVWFFGRALRLLPYFMYANSEGSGETARMCRLAWAFDGRLCDKYHNLMSWLIHRVIA